MADAIKLEAEYQTWRRALAEGRLDVRLVAIDTYLLRLIWRRDFRG